MHEYTFCVVFNTLPEPEAIFLLFKIKLLCYHYNYIEFQVVDIHRVTKFS